MPPGNGLFLTLSGGHSQYKESLINNLRNDGLGTSLGLSYGFQKNSLYHDIALSFNLGILKNRYQMVNYYINVLPSFSYRLMKELKINQLHAGCFVNYSSLQYVNENYDAQHNYWISHCDLGFTYLFKHQINPKLSLSIPISFPLIGVLSRPQANRQFVLNDPDLKIWDVIKRINNFNRFYIVGSDFFFIRTGMFLNFKLNNIRTFIIGYDFDFEQSRTSAKTQLVKNIISVKYQLTK